MQLVIRSIEGNSIHQLRHYLSKELPAIRQIFDLLPKTSAPLDRAPLLIKRVRLSPRKDEASA